VVIRTLLPLIMMSDAERDAESATHAAQAAAPAGSTSTPSPSAPVAGYLQTDRSGADRECRLPPVRDECLRCIASMAYGLLMRFVEIAPDQPLGP
jgi:hypothetical protein